MKSLLFTVLIASVALPSLGQKKGKVSLDSIHVKGKSFLILGDSSIYVENDTVLFMPDSVAVKLKRDEIQRSEEFYTKLKEKFYKSRFTKELYKLLFNDVHKSPDSVVAEEKVTVSNGNYKKYEGRVIDKIIVKKLEVFGTDINDTTKNIDSWAINIANDLHVYTRSRIIKNNLFFEEGDIVEPDELGDSERVLRNLPYIKDARIYVLSRSQSGPVEVLVIIKDIWSISGEISVDDFTKTDVAVIDKNFLGLGHEFRNELLFDLDNKPKIGYNGTYSINNIKSTFITGELNYANSEPLDRIGIQFYRNFITPEIKFGGGIDINRTNIRLGRVYRDTTIVFYTEFNQQDVWLGRSWRIDKAENEGRTNLQVAARYDRTRYLDRPFVTQDTNQQFFDRNLYLYSISIARRNYEKGSLIVGYGRTEDIPKGYLLELTSGKEVNEFYDRYYLGVGFATGRYYGRLGYLRPGISMGGFFREGTIEQGAVNLKVDYFSHLYRINKINFRQFFSLNYTRGINRFDNEYVTINNSVGVRGLRGTFLRGTKRITLSSETVAFTPFYIIGFRFAIFGFADLAYVNNESSKLFKNQLYQGYGLGLRLRNENLAINTIQLSLAWYPVTPPDQSMLGFDIGGQRPLRIPDFIIDRPEVIRFH